MPDYKAPTEDMLYVLGELLQVEETLAVLPGLEAIPRALITEVLQEAGRFCETVAQPLNRLGDEIGCRLEQGAVTTPPGFVEAYAAFVAGGWPGLSQDPGYGGQGLPRPLQILLDEMLSSANFSFGLFPGLTRGAAEAIQQHGSSELKETYLPKLVDGSWAGAMALTEAQAGTDLGLLRTKAEPADDGSYRLTGSKIFISAGDHDLTDNIIHLVLARLPGAAAGVKGISLFLVPKFLPDDKGEFALRNAMSVGSLEHKMGIRASPTCVMHYDDAVGWLVGEPHRGLNAMFTMMNAERLFVGIQGLGIAEAAYQGAAAYARQRLQGRLPGVSEGPPQSILVHPDIRRMLLTIRGFTEAGRALAVWLAVEMEKAVRHPEASVRAEAEGFVSLLTPVVKAAFTDLGFEAAVLGQQVLGGHGYIRDWGMEQLVRDARIAQIYEGTNGVQAMDLVGRKLPLDGGALPRRFFALVRITIADGARLPAAAIYMTPLGAALERLDAVTTQLLQRGRTDASTAGAAANDYLRLMALVALGWMWARMALQVLNLGEDAHLRHQAKLVVARFFMERLLPQSFGLEAAILAGPTTLMALGAEAF